MRVTKENASGLYSPGSLFWSPDCDYLYVVVEDGEELIYDVCSGQEYLARGGDLVWMDGYGYLGACGFHSREHTRDWMIDMNMEYLGNIWWPSV
jgi:hypothetical protein